MDANARARFAAGVLPAAEITETACKLAFASLAALPVYDSLTDEDAPHSDFDFGYSRSVNGDAEFGKLTRKLVLGERWFAAQARLFYPSANNVHAFLAHSMRRRLPEVPGSRVLIGNMPQNIPESWKC